MQPDAAAPQSIGHARRTTNCGRWRRMAQGRSVSRLVMVLVGLVLVVAACGAEPPTPRPSGGAGASPSGVALGATSDPTASSGLKACKGTDLKAAISEWAGSSSTR